QGMPMPANPSSGSAVPEASDPGGGSSVFESVGQMGLKLENNNATVDRLVIDHIEKTPTEN
ncbi:MAG: TIGR03435 family protein, partial [Bryobacteraceae bacterium]